MKLAVLSDIHSNHYALQSCMNRIEEQHVEGILFLGDYVSDCPYPEKTMDLIYDAEDKYKTWFVRGNREDIMIDRMLGKFEFGRTQASLRYTYEHLRKEDILFFQNLPLTQIVEIEGMPKISMAHGDLYGNKNKLYPDNENMERLLEELEEPFHLCGHTHASFIYIKEGKEIVNPGSVGVPVSGVPKAEIAILESDGQTWKPLLLKVEYDVERMIEEFYSSGLAECAGVWARCVMEELRTGRHYCGECVNLIEKYINETGLDFDEYSLWEKAAKELGI